MSKQRFAGLTLDELASAGKEAGAHAVERAHRAGVAVSGVTRLRFADGSLRDALTQLHADGTLEIKDRDICATNEVASGDSIYGLGLSERQFVVAKSNNVVVRAASAGQFLTKKAESDRAGSRLAPATKERPIKPTAKAR